jgi:hypothetical protein
MAAEDQDGVMHRGIFIVEDRFIIVAGRWRQGAGCSRGTHAGALNLVSIWVKFCILERGWVRRPG